MGFFDSGKSIIENISYLCAPILTLLGITGIIQIILAKKSIVITARREAAKLATEQIEKYNSQIIPLQNELFRLRQSKGLTKPEVAVGDFSYKYLCEKMGKTQVDKLWDERLAIIDNILTYINQLEVFSSYFTRGIADEEIAYSAAGMTFCKAVNYHFFEIAALIRDQNEDQFTNLRQLYKIWNNRLRRQKLMNDQNKILEQLNSTEEQKINPIGVK